MGSIRHFLSEVRLQNGEPWVGDVCFGSPEHPWIRTEVKTSSAELVARSADRVQTLVAAVMASLEKTVKASKAAIDELRTKGEVDSSDLEAVVHRTDRLEHLLTNLKTATDLAPVHYHSAVLIRWLEILGGSLVPGSAAASVKVVTVYVL